MAVWTVHAKDGVVIDGTEDVRFLKDGFSVAALIFGALWFIWHRMWIVLVGYLVVVGLLGALAASGLLAPFGVMLLQSLLAATVGLHATALRRWSMELRGFTEVAVVHADDAEAAEVRFFSGMTAQTTERRGELSVTPPPLPGFADAVTAAPGQA
ncbi:MAG: DUF2628 domain-containing protein [Pseudomonadota bacterium]